MFLASSWAQSWAYGCSECPDVSTCGCTYFTTDALSHGSWGGGYEGENFLSCRKTDILL